MIVNIITIFPEVFTLLKSSVLGRALEKNLWTLNLIDLKDFKHKKQLDDKPFAGGAGMVLLPEVIYQAISSIKTPGQLFYMSPRGKVIQQHFLSQVSRLKNVTIVCGRYEGIDQRVLDKLQIQEVSVGDYITCGGEAPSIVFVEGFIRLLKGVLGNTESLTTESFNDGLLEHDLYTQPRSWRGIEVPEVLLSGHGKKIAEWKHSNRISNTAAKRPDLIQK